TRFVDADGKPLPDAKKVKVDQREVLQDAKGKEIPKGTIEEVKKVGGKLVVVTADGRGLEGAKKAKAGGRDAVGNKAGEEIKGARAVTETVPNVSGWLVENHELICAKPHQGNDLLTEQKFTDFELHIEFQATSNSGVYLQGRYEIQIINSFGV